MAFVLCMSLQNDKRSSSYTKALSQKHPMAGWGFDARYRVSFVFYKRHKNDHHEGKWPLSASSQGIFISFSYKSEYELPVPLFTWKSSQ